MRRRTQTDSQLNIERFTVDLQLKLVEPGGSSREDTVRRSCATIPDNVEAQRVPYELFRLLGVTTTTGRNSTHPPHPRNHLPLDHTPARVPLDGIVVAFAHLVWTNIPLATEYDILEVAP